VTSEQAELLLNLVSKLVDNNAFLQAAEREQGKVYLEELEAKSANVTTWLEGLSQLLKRSTDLGGGMDMIVIDNPDEILKQVTLFPLLLGYCGYNQGNFEPLVVYYFSRLLARFNAQEIARYEGRDVAGMTDTWVAQREGELLMEPTKEALESFKNGFIFATVVQFGLFATAAYFLYQAITNALTPPPVDPLAF